MSCCVTIQGNGFVFVGTDTAVSQEINGEHIRIGYHDKFFQLNNNCGVFLSGTVEDAIIVLKYLKQLQDINIHKIEKHLKYLKDVRVLNKRIGILIVKSDKIVAFNWDNDFLPSIKYAPTGEVSLNTQAFSESCEEAQKNVLQYLNDHANITDKVIHDALLQGFKSIAKPNVGGQLNIHFIANNLFKKVNILKIDNIPSVTYKKDSGHCQLGNNFSVDNEGNLVATSVTIGGNGTIDFKNLLVKNLVVGQNVLMGDDAVIKWNNLPSDVADTTYVENYVSQHQTQLPSYITATKITQTTIESPTVNGGTFNGGTYKTWQNGYNGGQLDNQGLRLYKDTSQIGNFGYTNENIAGNPDALLINSLSGYAMKIQSGGNMSISPAQGMKIYQGTTVFTGDVLDKNGNPIGSGGSGTLVFG